MTPAPVAFGAWTVEAVDGRADDLAATQAKDGRDLVSQGRLSGRRPAVDRNPKGMWNRATLNGLGDRVHDLSSTSIISHAREKSVASRRTAIPRLVVLWSQR